MVFKKGDPAECDNYRPISILSIAYKIFAAMLKNRLLEARVQDALWSTQFGFRPGCGTEDAIFVARRHIEIACAGRYGKIKLLALDWKKAFDSVHTQSLLDALRRFGLPRGFQNKCLRSILKIQPSYVSRISNREVVQQAMHVPATKLLERRQLLQLGKVLRCQPDHPLQQSSFIPGTLTSATSRYVRRVGRPRKEWIPEVLSMEFLLSDGSAQNLQQTVQNVPAWRNKVRSF